MFKESSMKVGLVSLLDLSRHLLNHFMHKDVYLRGLWLIASIFSMFLDKALVLRILPFSIIDRMACLYHVDEICVCQNFKKFIK